MQPLRDNVEFHYENKVYPAQLVRYMGRIEETHRIIFTYKGVAVNEAFNGEDFNFLDIAQENCRIIDLIGKDEYALYSKYRDAIRKINKNYIVVDNNVYNHFEKSVDGGHVTYYIMAIGMENGDSVDGYPPTEFFEKDKYDRLKTFRYLKNRVLQKFKSAQIKPDAKHLGERKISCVNE